jgi:hypothetical protein
MTELSANFLLSNTMINRVAYQATDNSAIELALSRLQTTQLNAPCPVLPTATVNNLTASATYLSCWPANRETSNGTALVSGSAPFNMDGAQIQVNRLNEYVVGDAGGTVYDFQFSQSTIRWRLPLGGQVTATPLVIPLPGSSTKVLDVIPLTGPSCPSAGNCLNVRLDNGSSNQPGLECSVATTGGAVVSQPSSSPTQPGLVYYGDGTLLEATDVSVTGSGCDPESTVTVPGSQPVAAGPIAFACVSACGNTADEVYAVVSDNNSSRLVHYTYGNGNLRQVTPDLGLPWANVSGISVSTATLPAEVAISFHSGGVALVQIDSKGAMTLTATSVPAVISDAPFWCAACGNVFAVGGKNGVLYLFDASLNRTPSPSLGSPINTSPSIDGAGNWYVGTDDGKVHELQLQNGKLSERETYVQMGRFGSSPQVGSCAPGICIYLGGQDGNVYLVPLNARKAVISACITTSPPTCSGVNPRLWASVEVGANSGPQTVHVQGWSYYSG